MNQHIAVIWETFSQQLRHFIRSRVSDEAAADDILQEVFLKIHARLETLKNETKIESWIYQITRNTIIDHYRNQESALSVEIPETLADDQNLLRNTSHQQIASGLYAMIDELPEKYRQALLLTKFEGMTQKELAERLGISVSGAKSRVQRGREKLKDLLMQCCHFEFDHYGAIIDYHPMTCCCCKQPCQ